MWHNEWCQGLILTSWQPASFGPGIYKKCVLNGTRPVTGFPYGNPVGKRKSGNFYLRKTPKGSFMPLFPLNWTIAMVCFTACPLLKYRNFKDYKTRPPDLLHEQKKSDHITPSLVNLHWLPIEHCVIFKLLLYTYKALHGLAPDYLANLLTFYKPVCTLRSSRSINLFVSRSIPSTYGDRSFASVSPRLWNKLPDFIRYSETLDSFKTRLKTHLFKIAFNL